VKKRTPFDIQFLLESILSESPDRFFLDPSDVQKLEKTWNKTQKRYLVGGMI
jgi:hypothetical protein